MAFFSCYVVLLLCGLIKPTSIIKAITFPLPQPFEKLHTPESLHPQLRLKQQSLPEGLNWER